MTSDASATPIRRLPFGWLQRLDTWGHKLHVPKRILRPICDEYERRLQASYDWGYNSLTSTASSMARQMKVTWTRKRHDA